MACHPPPLRIFLSHKMGRDQEAAQTIAAHLSGYAGANVQVSCSSNYRVGDNWFEKVHHALENSDWLMLLYTNPKEDWQWCMYEVGYFNSIKADRARDKRIIVLCPQATKVPGPLAVYNPLRATPTTIRSLFEMIYADEPWRIAPNVFDEAFAPQLNNAVNSILESIDPTGLDTEQHSITIRIDLRKDSVEGLRGGAIPDKAVVSGTGPWEAAFGKSGESGGWTWRGLVTDEKGNDVDGRNYWEPVLASMMLSAYEKRDVDPTLLAFRVSPDGPVYRPVFHKLTRRDSGDLYFYFVLSPIPIADELRLDRPINILHNLLMLAWRYRTRLIDRHRDKVFEHAGGPVAPGDALKLLQTALADLNVLNAEAVSRGFTKFHSVVKPFVQTQRPMLMRLMQSEWPAGVAKFEGSVQVAREAVAKKDEKLGIKALGQALVGLDEIAALNAKFYCACADQYVLEVKKICGFPSRDQRITEVKTLRAAPRSKPRAPRAKADQRGGRKNAGGKQSKPVRSAKARARR